LQIRSVPVKKIAISLETATFIVGKPSVAAIRPRTPYGQKTAAFCPFLRSFLSPLSACLPIGQEQVVNLTLQDIFWAGSFPQGRPDGVGRRTREILSLFLTILPI
jgi:hypothetical protein